MVGSRRKLISMPSTGVLAVSRVGTSAATGVVVAVPAVPAITPSCSHFLHCNSNADPTPPAGAGDAAGCVEAGCDGFDAAGPAAAAAPPEPVSPKRPEAAAADQNSLTMS